MATKKTAAAPTEETEVMAPAEETAAAEPAEEPAKPVDEWQEEMAIYVERKTKGDDQSWFVCVNGRPFYVPANGRMQKLPKPVAMILQDAMDAERDAADFAEKMTNQAMANAGKL